MDCHCRRHRETGVAMNLASRGIWRCAVADTVSESDTHASWSEQKKVKGSRNASHQVITLYVRRQDSRGR